MHQNLYKEDPTIHTLIVTLVVVSMMGLFHIIASFKN